MIGRKGVPYGSRDTEHVLPPNPENFWAFDAGQVHTIAVNPELSFQVNAIHDTWIEGTELLDGQIVEGELHLDRPVVIMRDAKTKEPMVTLTLRRIADGTAFIQVSADPKGGSVRRRQ